MNKSIAEIEKKILRFPWDIFRNNVDQFLINLEVKNLYKLSKYSEPTILSSAFALILKHSLNLKINSKTIDKIIKSYDENSKLFLCSKILKTNPPNRDYLLRQTRYFCRVVLRLKDDIKLDTSFRSFPDIYSYYDWIDNLDWNRPWDISNEVMFELDNLLNPPTCRENKQIGIELLKYLLNNVCNSTGYWGNTSSSDLEKMYGSMHLYSFYIVNNFVLNRKKIILETLTLINSGGCFYPIIGGGACPDYDGTSILIWFNINDEYKKILLSVFNNHLFNQVDGLFVDSLRFKGEKAPSFYPSYLKEWMNRNYHYYSNWNVLKYKISKPNIWACWVRSMSIAMIQNIFEIHNSFKYIKYPGLGWNYYEEFK